MGQLLWHLQRCMQQLIIFLYCALKQFDISKKFRKSFLKQPCFPFHQMFKNKKRSIGPLKLIQDENRSCFKKVSKKVWHFSNTFSCGCSKLHASPFIIEDGIQVGNFMAWIPYPLLAVNIFLNFKLESSAIPRIIIDTLMWVMTNRSHLLDKWLTISTCKDGHTSNLCHTFSQSLLLL